MKKYDKALEILNVAVSKFPDQPYAYSNRGLAKHIVGKSKDGIKDIEKSLKIDPSNSYAYRNLAIIYSAIGETDEACKNAIRAIELNFSTNYGGEMELFYKNNCTKK